MHRAAVRTARRAPLRRLASSVALLGAMFTAAHAGWSFSPAVTVAGSASSKQQTHFFHHLESAGRKNIAVSGGVVAVVWEDNHTGSSQVYVAFKREQANAFSAPVQLSTGQQAYEPAVAPIAGARFVVAWEQDGHVWLRAAGPGTKSAAQRVSAAPSRQASLAAGPDQGPNGRIQLVWVQRDGHFPRVMTAPVRTAPRLHVGSARPVDAKPPKQSQLYPSVALTRDRIVVAWEDRRSGHTRLLYSAAGPDGAFSAPRGLNEFRVGNAKFGRGTGVTRVALAAMGGQRVGATWMDKRDFRGGYDIYAALSDDGGRHFGANEKVQDVFGNDQPQWHPAIAATHDGQVAAAWDDPRDNTEDVWLSWRTPDGWSDDAAVGPASGPGVQSDPVLAFDREGNLHIAWIARPSPNGPTRILYSVAHPTP